MRVRVLGSAAGGGFPQWNCGCHNCAEVRLGAAHLSPRTQASLAVSADGNHWFLLNASPDIHRQIQAFPALWPKEKRGSPIAGIVLTNGDLDHCLGLFSLRESQPLTIYATAAVMRGFTEKNALYKTLERFPGQVTWKLLPLGIPSPLAIGSRESGLTVTAVPCPGKRPVHLSAGDPASESEDNVGLILRGPVAGQSLAYFPAVGNPSGPVLESLGQASVIFFDGTFWSEMEMAEAGVGTARAKSMAHWPLGGPRGSLVFLSRFGSRRRILTHINNTNPILRDNSRERLEALSHGVEAAWDGMEFSL